MKRLGVVVLYDSVGTVDDYIEVLLSALHSITSETVLVINGYMDGKSLENLRRYTDNIFLRENIGFDAGAYKDLFLRFIPYDTWKEYDEIILMNDTFFGPITPLDIFMDRFSIETFDFCGITRHPKFRNRDNEIVESHIQAYFLVIRKKLIVSQCFYEFWDNLSYPLNYREAIKDFEIRFTSYFEERGFCGKSWMDLQGSLTWWKEDGNPYILHSFELIKELRVPFIKKKCLWFENDGYMNALRALEYIEEEKTYNTSLIWNNILRLCRNNLFHSVLDYDKLERFYAMHERIFIYGTGKYGQRMQRYFQYRKWVFEGFLVSENTDGVCNCNKYEEVDFEPMDGIILALGKPAFKEVHPMLMEKMDETQLFLLEYDLQ